MRRSRAAGLLLGLAAGCGDNAGNSPPTDDLALSGGATTVFDATSGAFKAPAPNLSGASFARHQAGAVLHLQAQQGTQLTLVLQHRVDRL